MFLVCLIYSQVSSPTRHTNPFKCLSFYLCEPQARSRQSADWTILAFEVCRYFHTHHTPGGKILCFRTIWCGRWDSNPPCMQPKCIASCRWATSAYYFKFLELFSLPFTTKPFIPIRRALLHRSPPSMAHANTDEFLTLRLSMLGLYKFLVHSFGTQ